MFLEQMCILFMYSVAYGNVGNECKREQGVNILCVLVHRSTRGGWESSNAELAVD